MQQDLIIQIDWAFFLGIMGALIAIAWYSGSRFSALETSMRWVKETLNELKLNADNASNKPAFGSQSPINLTVVGEQWLQESGMKKYIDINKEDLMGSCSDKRETNPYEVQKYVFRIFDSLVFDEDSEDRFKKFAFEKGTTMSVIRRIGGIYFRNLCLERFNMNKDDIDKHDPEKGSKLE